MTGRLILVCGLPGSGKTTLARSLEQEQFAVRLCPDEWMQSLHVDGYDNAARARVELLQRELAVRLVALGCVVVLEFGFWGRDERLSLRDEARSLGAAAELRFLDTPLDVLWERVDARNQALPWGSFPISRDDLGAWFAQFEVPDAQELAGFDEPA